MGIEIRNWEMGELVNNFFAKVFGIKSGETGEQEAFEIGQDCDGSVEDEKLKGGALDKSEVERAGCGYTFDGGVRHVPEDFRAEESEEVSSDGENKREEEGEFMMF